MTTKEKLLGLQLKQETVQIEGITVIVKEMLAGDGSAYDNSLYKIVGNKPIIQTKDAEIKLVIYSCFDEEGKKLFEIEDIEQAKMMPNHVVEYLYSVAKKLNNSSKAVAVKN